jgi:hypothetical protein
MEYIFIGVIVFFALVLGGVFWWNSQKNKRSFETNVIQNQEIKMSSSTLIEDEMNKLMIYLEQLPEEAISNEKNLMEITDSKILAHINNLVPGIFQAGNAAVNAIQTNGQVLYQAIIPAGAKLANSQDMAEAVRGIYHGVEGVKGHANLVAVNNNANIATHKISAAMSVSSMVVGQYYMTQINAELGLISESISKVSDFQDNEYRSRVFSLIAHVKTIADFQVEILENNELRLSKISQLDSLEEECTQLLGQANLTLAGYAKKKDIDYKTYERELNEAQNWYLYQKSLLDVMYKISDLRYTLHLGAVSREQCVALLPVFRQQVIDTQTRLTNWHQDAAKRLNIDIDETRRKRDGFDRVIHFFPGLIRNELNFRTIDKSVANIIDEQSYGNGSSFKYEQSELYLEDVQLIAKDGKVYYLPESKAD